MTRGRWILVTATALVVILAAWFFVRPWFIDREIQRAITRYDLALAHALATLDASALEGAATEQQSRNIDSYIGVLMLEGVAYESELVSLELVSATEITDGLAALADEEWHYRKVDSATGATVATYNETLRLRYTLRRVDGELRVHDVLVESSTRASGE